MPNHQRGKYRRTMSSKIQIRKDESKLEVVESMDKSVTYDLYVACRTAEQ